jgi:ferric-dicitrate binding protein FerR (iron transport regulator)
VSDRHDKLHEHSEHAHALMMAALDNELTAAERAEFETMLAADASLKQEWERLKAVKEVTGTMALREPPEEIWETYWVSVYNRAERSIAWLFLSLGLIVLFAWAGWHAVGAVLADTEMPLLIKISIFAAALGGGVLLFSVIREKWFARKNDPYKEVLR